MSKMSVNSLLKQAKRLVQQGEIAKGCEVYESIVEKYPANKTARMALDALRTPRLKQENINELKQLAHLLTVQNFGEAQRGCSAFVKKHPNVFDAWNMLGVAAAKLNDLETAEHALANAVALQHNNAEALNNYGNVLNSRNDYEHANTVFERAIALKPHFAQAYNNQGNTQIGLGQWQNAISNYKEAIKHLPDYAEAFLNLGYAYGKLHSLDAQQHALSQAVQLEPHNPIAHLALAETSSKLGDPDKALEHYDKAIECRPNWRDATLFRAAHLKNMGHTQEAIKAYSDLLAQSPQCGEVYRQLSDLQTYTLDDPFTKAMEIHWANSDVSSADRCQIGFGLYNVYEKAGKNEAAFDTLSAANRLRRGNLNYSIKRDLTLFDKIKSIQGHLSSIAVSSKTEPTTATGPFPIFVLGMPRSGTSLIEQIISSHAAIDGAGELPYFYEASSSALQDPKSLSEQSILTMRRTYLTQLRQHGRDGAWISDKMPQNFLLIGLIKTALPEARIVHVKRNPRAICWSNFKSYFGGEGMGHAYDLEDTVTYYNLYKDLMSFWEEQYPNELIHVDYDALVNEPEKKTRDLINEIGLEWDHACLAPHKNTRSVRTVSKLQVRSPIYKGSSQAWRKYQRQLDPIFAQLPDEA